MDLRSSPEMGQVRELVCGSRDGEGWKKCWEEGLTPWDLGNPTPAVTHLVQSEALPKGRVLVPGCGTGYDVVALASKERFVVGVDISEGAIAKAKKWSSSFPNANCLFLAADFFNWNPTEQFDLIFDYTFFCAIDPSMRLDWAKKISDMLKPDGELITLMYLVSDHEGGPPYNNAVADYNEVLEPMGFMALSIEDNELALEQRKLHAFVEYETVDNAEKAVIELNDGKNWSGLRVRLLLRCLKHEPGRGRKSGHEGNDIANEDDIATTNQPFKTVDSSQSSGAFVDHLGEESFNDKEVRLRHEKGRGRGGQGMGRRQHHSTDHHDGGRTADNPPPHHQVHAEKPLNPMPDGTKGITMDRGKPLNPMQIN